MTNIDPNVLRKIKKCLALGGSPNPHEAAAAMRQAHALMQKHGVDTSQVTMSEIGEAQMPSRTMARDKPARWEAALASMVGKAFGCQLMMSRMVSKNKRVVNEGTFIFVGLKAQVELASYTAEVLSRKCKSARAAFIRERLHAVAKKNATNMGNAFAEGWVHAIGKLVHDFANPPEIQQAIEKYITTSVGSSTATAPVRDGVGKDIKAEEIAAARLGMEKAKAESLYRPMDKDPAQAAIGMR